MGHIFISSDRGDSWQPDTSAFSSTVNLEFTDIWPSDFNNAIAVGGEAGNIAGQIELVTIGPQQ
ncbi:MAG: hypothetical protein U5L96_04345 [Owenweeksia sp.]|nr:hypothetical protein [Owenweeksia sp.]